jgi:hypothetical protein
MRNCTMHSINGGAYQAAFSISNAALTGYAGALHHDILSGNMCMWARLRTWTLQH